MFRLSKLSTKILLFAWSESDTCFVILDARLRVEISSDSYLNRRVRDNVGWTTDMGTRVAIVTH